MIPPGAIVCAAVSGGPDSVALLFILRSLCDKFHFSLQCCHYDHAYRVDSSEDMRFVANLCERLGVPFIADRNTGGKPESAAQNTARELRYAFFEKLMGDGYCDIIATGHTLDDSVETSVMWMLRGTGPHSFGGIPPVRERYIRPLIDCEKAQIVRWLEERNVEYRVDPTNLGDDYLRNRIRRHVIPVMKNFAPGAVEAVARLARISLKNAEVVDAAAKTLIGAAMKQRDERCAIFDPAKLMSAPEAARWSAYRLALASLGATPASVSLDRIEALDKLLISGKLGGVIQLPGGFIGTLDHGGFAIRKVVEAPEPLEMAFVCPMDIRFGDGALRVTENEIPGAARVDMEKIPGDSVFRVRRPGDYLILKNFTGRKKLKTFFIDRKFPASQRDRTPILAAGSEVLWIPAHYCAERILANDATRQAIFMSWVAG